MRIAFFTDTYLPNVDGVVRTVVDLRHQMQARHNQVYIFTSGNKPNYRVDDPNVFYHRSVAFPLYPQYKVALFPYLSAVNTARKQKIQVVHSHAMTSMGVAAVTTAKTLKLPLVGTFHTMLPKAVHLVSWNKSSEKAASRMIWRALEIFYSQFNVMTAPSHIVAKTMEEHGIMDVKVMPNGVDQTRFRPDKSTRGPIRRSLGFKEDAPLVLVAGRLSPEKNVPVIVRSVKATLKEVPEARFVITGEGPAQKEVEKLVKTLGLGDKIRLVGFLSENQIRDYYCAADVFATASTFETQGLAALEALASGTPVVGANALAIPETVKNGWNGYLFTPSDSHDCAQKIVKVLTASSSVKKRLSANGRKTALRFSLKAVTDNWLKLYQDLI